MVGNTLQIVGEKFARPSTYAAGIASSTSPTGSGNATLAAARRFADVVSTDYVGALLEHGRERRGRNASRSPSGRPMPKPCRFPGRVDVVLSTFGVMFTPNQEKAAAGAAAGLHAARQDRARQLELRRASSASSSRPLASTFRRHLA